MRLNKGEKILKEVIEKAEGWVGYNKELEVIHWDGTEDCKAGWYAYEYGGDQSVPIYANDYDRVPLVTDEEIDRCNINVIKVLNICNVAYCG